MKMSARGSAPAGPEGTMIGHDCRIKGEVALSGVLCIDGFLEGEVKGSGHVRVNGRFAGTLQANALLVSGQVNGTVICDRVEIAGGGQLQGEVTCLELIIHEGGRFVGRRREQVAV